MNNELIDDLAISTSDEIGDLPPGRYILGDPCLMIVDPIWQKVVVALDDLREGELTIETPELGELTGIFFSPYEEDGVYEVLNHDAALPVDSGLLALLPQELVDLVGPSLHAYEKVTVTVESQDSVTTSEDDGVFTIHADDDYPISLGR